MSRMHLPFDHSSIVLMHSSMVDPDSTSQSGKQTMRNARPTQILDILVKLSFWCMRPNESKLRWRIVEAKGKFGVHGQYLAVVGTLGTWPNHLTGDFRRRHVDDIPHWHLVNNAHGFLTDSSRRTLFAVPECRIKGCAFGSQRTYPKSQYHRQLLVIRAFYKTNFGGRKRTSFSYFRVSYLGII